MYRSKPEQLRFAYDAFNKRDIENVLAVLAADVDWPNAIENTRLEGHDAVREYWTTQWRTLDPKVEPLEIAEDGEGNQVVTVHQTVHDNAGQLLVDQTIQHVYRFKGDRVARMDIVNP